MSAEALAVVGTIRIATVLYVASLALQIGRGGERAERAARCFWSAGVLFFLAHVLGAFHYVHGYSHARAYAATARDTEALFGVASGAGLWLNYAFTIVWAADAAWWWVDSAGYRTRSRWLSVAVHSFLAFMFVNGAIVFATGPSRFIGLGAIVVLALVGLRSRRRLAQRAGFGGSAT